jgi:hypothetical protein
MANPLSQIRVSLYKILALQKDRGCRTFPLWFFSLVNQLQATLVSCQSVSGELSPSINVTLKSDAVMGSIVKYEDRKTLRFFIPWLRTLNLTERRNVYSIYQTQYPNCGLRPLRECDWNDRIGNSEHCNWEGGGMQRIILQNYGFLCFDALF